MDIIIFDPFSFFISFSYPSFNLVFRQKCNRDLSISKMKLIVDGVDAALVSFNVIEAEEEIDGVIF